MSSTSTRSIPGLGWWGGGIAACAAVAAGMVLWLRPTPALPQAPAISALRVPVAPQPMVRLVAGTFDQPLRDEAMKMVDDTRRATRALVQCVPFTRRGG